MGKRDGEKQENGQKRRQKLRTGKIERDKHTRIVRENKRKEKRMGDRRRGKQIEEN